MGRVLLKNNWAQVKKEWPLRSTLARAIVTGINLDTNVSRGWH